MLHGLTVDLMWSGAQTEIDQAPFANFGPNIPIFIADVLLSDNSLLTSAYEALRSLREADLVCFNRVRAQAVQDDEGAEVLGEQLIHLLRWRSFLARATRHCGNVHAGLHRHARQWIERLQLISSPQTFTATQLQLHVEHFGRLPSDLVQSFDLELYKEVVHTIDALTLQSALTSKQFPTKELLRCYVQHIWEPNDWILSNDSTTWAARSTFELSRVNIRDEGCNFEQLTMQLSSLSGGGTNPWDIDVSGTTGIIDILLNKISWLVVIIIVILILVLVGYLCKCLKLEWITREIMIWLSRVVDACFCRQPDTWFHNRATQIRQWLITNADNLRNDAGPHAAPDAGDSDSDGPNAAYEV